MDKGFLDEKYDIVFANDRFEKKALRSYHLDTYRQNIGNHIIMLEFRERDIPEVDFVAAGVPCVTFSALNNTHWQAYALTLDKSGSYRLHMSNTTNQFVVVRKGEEHPEAALHKE